MGAGQTKEARKTLTQTIDQIATNYILTQDFNDLTKLSDAKYCNELIVLTTEVLDKLGKKTIERLVKKQDGTDEDRIITKEEIMFLNKRNLKNYDVRNVYKKKYMCNGISRFYIRIANLFAAITTTINAEYKYETGVVKRLDKPLKPSSSDALPRSSSDALQKQSSRAMAPPSLDEAQKQTSQAMPPPSSGEAQKPSFSSDQKILEKASSSSQVSTENYLANKQKMYGGDGDNPLQQKDILGKQIGNRNTSNNICDKRINALKSDTELNKQPGDEVTIKLKICDMNNKAVLKSVSDKSSGDITLYNEPGIKELDMLYNDVYDLDTDKGFYKVSDDMKKTKKRDLRRFYETYTGNSFDEDKITSFKDIPLNNYKNDNNCSSKDPSKGYYMQSYSGIMEDRDDNLFNKYAKHVKSMMYDANNKRDKLKDILDRVFVRDKVPTSENPSAVVITINPSLTDEKLTEIVDETRRIIVSLYLKCEKDFTEGVKIFESIAEDVTAQSAIDVDEKLEQQVADDEEKQKLFNNPIKVGRVVDHIPYEKVKSPVVNPVIETEGQKKADEWKREADMLARQEQVKMVEDVRDKGNMVEEVRNISSDIMKRDKEREKETEKEREKESTEQLRRDRGYDERDDDDDDDDDVDVEDDMTEIEKQKEKGMMEKDLDLNKR